ncbi:MAG: PqqD family protein [Ignisphaera sp.]
MSEDWDILEDFNGNSYLLNLKSGEAYEISPVIFRFLSLLDGKKTLKEIIDVLAQTFLNNETFDKSLNFFLKEGLKKGFLKKCFI